MRGLFQRGAARRLFKAGEAGQDAQRDVLRETKTNIEQDNQPQSSQKQPTKQSRANRLPQRKHLVTAFLLASLGNEAAHFHEAHNPHGNRRERIEEIRMRMQEAESQARRYHNMAGSGGGGTPDPFHPVEIALQEVRRRTPQNRPAHNA